MSDHPYQSQPDKAFWRKTVAATHPMDITNWYTKKFPLQNSRIATAGSCFAQHIGRELRQKGFNYVDVEPAPSFLERAMHTDFGFGMYSGRYGNIYTSRQLLQLVKRALGEFKPVEPAWEKDGGFVDPFRPTIEPEPFESIEEMETSRNRHLERVLKMFELADVFVFTFGLTETWLSKVDGSAFPICPGVSGGKFDSERHAFVNLNYNDVMADMRAFVERVRSINSDVRLLLTVSPVPLMATATNKHVAVATMHSKSVLRAVAGTLAGMPGIDYFPSFEIISAHFMRGMFYNPDWRTVNQFGVDHVMKQFFKEHRPPAKNVASRPEANVPEDDDVVCDEELLGSFGRKK